MKAIFTSKIRMNLLLQSSRRFRDHSKPEEVTILITTFKNGEPFQHYIRCQDGCEFWANPWEIDSVRYPRRLSPKSPGA